MEEIFYRQHCAVLPISERGRFHAKDTQNFFQTDCSGACRCNAGSRRGSFHDGFRRICKAGSGHRCYSAVSRQCSHRNGGHLCQRYTGGSEAGEPVPLGGLQQWLSQSGERQKADQKRLRPHGVVCRTGISGTDSCGREFPDDRSRTHQWFQLFSDSDPRGLQFRR